MTLKTNKPYWKRFSAIFSALLFLSLSNPSYAVKYVKLPDLGDSTKAQVTEKIEQEFAQALIGQIYQSRKPFDDPIVSSYVKKLTKKLAQSSQLTHFEPKLFLINDTTINAFAGPGNVIGVHAGLFIYAQTLSEFASVMAHELGHLNYKHFALMSQQADKTYKQLLLPVIAGLLIAFSGDSNNIGPAIGVFEVGNTIVANEYFSYSRQLETEADIFAIQALTENKIDPNGLPDFFKTLLQNYGNQDNVPNFVMSHPVSQNRISYTRARIKESLLPMTDITEDNLDYQLARARVLAESLTGYFSFKQSYKQFQYSDNPEEKLLFAYHALLAHTLPYDLEKLESVIGYLKEQAPMNVIIAQSIADAYLPINQVEAKKAIERMLKIAPESEASQFIAYEFHLQNKNAKQAKHYSQALASNNQSSIYYWQLEAKLHRLNQNTPQLHRSLAEIQLLKNQPEAARGQFEIAMVECGNDFLCKTTLQQRMKALKL